MSTERRYHSVKYLMVPEFLSTENVVNLNANAMRRALKEKHGLNTDILGEMFRVAEERLCDPNKYGKRKYLHVLIDILKYQGTKNSSSLKHAIFQNTNNVDIAIASLRGLQNNTWLKSLQISWDGVNDTMWNVLLFSDHKYIKDGYSPNTDARMKKNIKDLCKRSNSRWRETKNVVSFTDILLRTAAQNSPLANINWTNLQFDIDEITL